jgi:hypothetical protein
LFVSADPRCLQVCWLLEGGLGLASAQLLPKDPLRLHMKSFSAHQKISFVAATSALPAGLLAA